MLCAVAIPAHNEADLIGDCLAALANQTVGGGRFATIILANNCADATVGIAQAFGLAGLEVIEQTFPPECAHAGSARRSALRAAAECADLILTTDADSVPDRNWVETMLAAFANGVDGVAGRVSGNWDDMQHWPADVLAIGALEWEYLQLMGQAAALFNPQPHDPAPRHVQRCGANLGITRAMLETVGGVPAIPTGEDRALFAAVEACGGKIRHDPLSHVTTSARLEGRARGGMADALAARRRSDYRCGDEFEGADLFVERMKAIACGRLFDIVGPRLTPDKLPAEITRLADYIRRHGRG